MFTRTIAAIGLATLLAAPLSARTVIDSERASFEIETVAEGLKNPWGLAFLPNGSMLVTEREGSLRLVSSSGEVRPALKGLPKLFAKGQGGLLDVAIDPDYANNGRIYFSYSEPSEDGDSNSTAVAGIAGQSIFSSGPSSSIGSSSWSLHRARTNQKYWSERE